ncbi:hypothetical protein [Nocardioides zeicaulis]|uniref:Uncharacterized protein n=1 Tax=Nocardioides zeicaulis TaxID=1776857 RepID=A0ABV6DYG8_9ACTN
MSRIALIPVAVLLAAGAVVAGPGESAPAQPARSDVSHVTDTGITATAR